MRRIPFFSLRIRLLLIVIIFVIPGLTLAIYTLVEDRQREKGEAQNSAFRLAQIIAVQEQDLIEATKELLVALSHEIGVLNGAPQERDALLGHLLKHFGRYSNIAFADPSGDVVSSAIPLVGKVTASDGAEAIDVYKQNRSEIEVVLTDLGLPILSGQQLVKALMEINNSLKLIIASGYLDPENKSEILKSGVKGFIQKPYRPEEVLETIRRVLDEQRITQ